MSPNDSDSVRPELDAAFSSKFPFAALTFQSAAERRKTASKFSRTGIAADAATAAATLFSDAHAKMSLPAGERTNTIGESWPVLRRLRVLVPLLEPNVLRMGRGYSRPGPYPQDTRSPDGVWVARWADPAQHAAATKAVVEDYYASHEVARAIGTGEGRLDSWHNPFLVVAVRHEYKDGSPGVTRWMCADGNAMLVGARYALAADLVRWGVEHPFADPTAMWPTDMASLRTVVRAAREALTHQGDPASMEWPRLSSVEQWADLVLPGEDLTPLSMSTWLYHEHNTDSTDDSEDSDTAPETGAAGGVGSEGTHADFNDWVTTLDYFAGLDATDLQSILDADPTTRAGRVVLAQEEADIEKYLMRLDDKPRTAARLAFVAAALHSTQEANRHLSPDDRTNLWASFTERATRRTDPTTTRTLAVVRDLVCSSRTFPDCDLYGIYQDLISGSFDGAPFTDTDNNWFTLTALVGMSYAALHGHLIYSDTGDVPWLDAFISTTPGPATEATIYYAQCAARGLIPDNRYRAVAQAISKATLGLLDDLATAMGVTLTETLNDPDTDTDTDTVEGL